MNTITGKLEWRHIAESHLRQLNGEDFQAVAISIAERIGVEWEDDEYTELQSMPGEGCECEACQRYEWQS